MPQSCSRKGQAKMGQVASAEHVVLPRWQSKASCVSVLAIAWCLMVGWSFECFFACLACQSAGTLYSTECTDSPLECSGTWIFNAQCGARVLAGNALPLAAEMPFLHYHSLLLLSVRSLYYRLEFFSTFGLLFLSASNWTVRFPLPCFLP